MDTDPPLASASQHAPEKGYEATDVNVRGLFIFAGSLLVALLVILAGIAVLFQGYGALDRYLDRQRAAGEPGANSRVHLPPDYQGPLLQIRPEQDLAQLRRADDADQHGYGWVNRDKGVVRIPIDRAMDLLAQRGLPPTAPGVSPEQMQQQRADPQVYGQSLRP